MKSLLSLLPLLLMFAAVRAGDHAPAVYLSHFFVVLDQASYDALRSSAQVAALAAVEEKRVEAGSRNWTGLYVRGRRTYMEFFGGGAPPEGARVGDCGLGLTVEEPGGVLAVAALLRKAFGEKVQVHAVPRTTKAGTIPWFTAAEVASGSDEALGTWFMEIDPGYLAAQHPGSRIEHPLGREQYLSWDFLPDRPLDDVVGLTAALGSSEMSQLAGELEIAGWAVRRDAGGFVATGPEVRLTAVPAHARAGIQQAELRLRQSVPRQTIELGGARLLLEGRTGQLIFWSPD